MEDKSKRVGILGGTFNPIHNGHISLARKALVQFQLDKVLFMPAKVPPHKNNSNIISEEHRGQMVKLAIKDMDYFEYSDFEFKREGRSYTYKTLELLCKENPDTQYYFIIGADSLFQFENWKYPEKILKNASLIVAKRNNVSDVAFQQQIEHLADKYNGEILPLIMDEIPISSTDIRLKIANNKNVSEHLAPWVIEYISENEFYQDMKCQFTDYEACSSLKEVLKKRLDSNRYEHSICVANLCAALAMKYEYNIFDAYLAGLLHDIAKCTPDQELLNICQKNCINITDVEKKNPYLLHGKVGAFIAKSEFYVCDDEILESIIYHTTGRPEMGLLEKIVFIADYIEPMRDKAPNLMYIRKLAFEDIDKTVRLILDNMLAYLTANGIEIDNTTKIAYQYYKNN